MNAHQPDGIFLTDRPHLRLGLRAFLCVDKAQKPEQALALEIIKLLHQPAQELDVGVALFPTQLG